MIGIYSIHDWYIFYTQLVYILYMIGISSIHDWYIFYLF